MYVHSVTIQILYSCEVVISGHMQQKPCRSHIHAGLICTDRLAKLQRQEAASLTLQSRVYIRMYLENMLIYVQIGASNGEI